MDQMALIYSGKQSKKNSHAGEKWVLRFAGSHPVCDLLPATNMPI
jgi:hypothetical protein